MKVISNTQLFAEPDDSLRSGSSEVVDVELTRYFGMNAYFRYEINTELADEMLSVKAAAC